MDIAKALPVVFGEEGGTGNLKGDPGGLTSRGISTPLALACCRRFGWPVVPPDRLTQEQVVTIYKTQFWEPCKCSLLPDDWAIALFDMAVNSGVRTAILTVQAVLAAKGLYTDEIDGEMGPNTIQAIRKGSAGDFVAARAAFYVALIVDHPQEADFIRGWINRVKNQLRVINRLDEEKPTAR